MNKRTWGAFQNAGNAEEGWPQVLNAYFHWKRHMNRRAAVAGGVCYGVNENLKRTAKVHLQKGYENSLTAVAVAACYRSHQNMKSNAFRLDSFIQKVSNVVRDDGVRL